MFERFRYSAEATLQDVQGFKLNRDGELLRQATYRGMTFVLRKVAGIVQVRGLDRKIALNWYTECFINGVEVLSTNARLCKEYP